jgi:hypothetical protein
MMFRKILTFFLFAPPVLAGAFFLYHYGVNVLWLDEFDLVPLATSERLPSLAILFQQHNEHRIFFPQIVYFFLAKASAMNSLAVMWVSFVLVAALYGAALRQLSRQASGPVLLCSGFLLGCALFYPSQQGNILWAFQLTFYMTFVFAILAILLFQGAWDKNRASVFSWRLALALAAAVIASFSSSQGLVIWPVIVTLWLFAAGKKALTAKTFWLWLVTEAAVWLLYFHGYTKPAHHPSLATVLTSPLSWQAYILALFGSVFSWSGSPFVIGALGFLILASAAMAIALFIRSCLAGQPAGLFAAGVIIYSLFCGLLIAMGRAGFGWRQALSSRYCTFTLAAVWGITSYLAIWSGKEKDVENRPRCLIVFFCLLFVAVTMAISLPKSLRTATDWQHQNLLWRYYLRTADWQTDDNLKALYFPSPDVVRRYAAKLRERNYNAVAGWAAPDWRTIEGVAAPSNFPLVLDQAATTADTLSLRGWCFDPQTAKPAQSIWLNLGEKRFLLFSSVPRPDVARALKNEALAFTGFTADIPLAATPPGDFPLRFAVIGADGSKLYEVTKDIRLVQDADGARLERPGGR